MTDNQRALRSIRAMREDIRVMNHQLAALGRAVERALTDLGDEGQRPPEGKCRQCGAPSGQTCRHRRY